MVSIGWVSSISLAVFSLSWVANVAGAIVALVMLIRHRNAASALALIGFGIPALIGPIYMVLRWALVARMGVQALITVTALNGLLSFVALVCLVIAFWLALRPTDTGAEDRPRA
jgi:hypothetical protein